MLNRSLFDVLPIQAVVANASPSAWRDGLVVSQRPGALTVMLLDGQEGMLITGATPAVGEPVAVHPVAEVIAIGDTWYSARPLVGGDA